MGDQILAFPQTKEIDDEWETQHILLDIQQGNIEPGLLEGLKGEYKILGLETQTPYIQLDKIVLKGYYQESFGTDMVFAKAQPSAGEDNSSHSVSLECTTTTRIAFSRAFVVPRDANSDASSADTAH